MKIRGTSLNYENLDRQMWKDEVPRQNHENLRREI